MAGLRVTVHRRIIGRIVPTVAGVVLAGSVLTGCHGPPHAVPVIAGVSWPTSFFVTPDNTHIWYSERFTGEIHRRNLQTNSDTLVFTVSNVLGAGEQGLLGVALHPNYPTSPYLYAYATRRVGGSDRNQVLKITVSNGVGIASQVIFDSSAGTFHNGGRILFGPDGMLYIVVGENTIKANAQDLSATNKAGKIHRITPDGGVPANNPIAGNSIWASASATRSGSASTRRTASCGKPTTGPSATTRSTASARLAITRGGRTPPARGRSRRPRTPTRTVRRRRGSRSTSTRRPSASPGSRSARAAGWDQTRRERCWSARPTTVTSTA